MKKKRENICIENISSQIKFLTLNELFSNKHLHCPSTMYNFKWLRKTCRRSWHETRFSICLVEPITFISYRKWQIRTAILQQLHHIDAACIWHIAWKTILWLTYTAATKFNSASFSDYQTLQRQFQQIRRELSNGLLDRHMRRHTCAQTWHHYSALLKSKFAKAYKKRIPENYTSR